MSIQSFFRVFVLSTTLLVASPLLAQELVMHAENPEALQLVQEALDNMGHDMGKFGDNVTQAAQLDPSMLAANFFEAMDPDKSKEESRVFIERMQSYQGEMSPGEEILKEMSSHFDDEDYDFFSNLTKLGDAYPEDPRINILVGTAYMYNQAPDKAIPYLSKAADQGGMLGAYNMLGYAHMSQGQFDKAEKFFEAYLEAAPGHENPYDSMGDLMMAQKEYAKAASYFEQAATINPGQGIHAEKAAKARELMNE